MLIGPVSVFDNMSTILLWNNLWLYIHRSTRNESSIFGTTERRDHYTFLRCSSLPLGILVGVYVCLLMQTIIYFFIIWFILQFVFMIGPLDDIPE
ncbi:hypothetical protein BDW59DRAFT_75837 [Aspergillus cavernicola]|uniref:Uncharacterized protein n=1 Tax=Aspergillus cavernicola TaxID=176166 RepID=A0ABR4IDQ6_9EURO